MEFDVPSRERREKFKAAGKCSCCGRHNDRPDRAKCSKCFDYENNKRKILMSKKICKVCGGSITSGGNSSRCTTCTEKHNIYSKELRMTKFMSFLCISCSIPISGSKSKCNKCAEKHDKTNRKRRDKYKEQGRCTECGTKQFDCGMGTMRICDICLEKKRINRQLNSRNY